MFWACWSKAVSCDPMILVIWPVQSFCDVCLHEFICDRLFLYGQLSIMFFFFTVWVPTWVKSVMAVLFVMFMCFFDQLLPLQVLCFSFSFSVDNVRKASHKLYHN